MESNLELELINHFVRKDKRERLLMFASKARTRDKMLREFSSPDIFESVLRTEINGADRTLDNLLRIYGRHGMSESIYVISENDEWDGCHMDTRLILDGCLAACTDTIGYCSKSKTAFYEWHHSGSSYFLDAKKRA